MPRYTTNNKQQQQQQQEIDDEQNQHNNTPWKTSEYRNKIAGSYGISLITETKNDEKSYKETLQIFLKCIYHEEKPQILQGLLECICELVLQRCNNVKGYQMEEYNILINEGANLLEEASHCLGLFIKKLGKNNRNDGYYTIMNELFEIANRHPSRSTSSEKKNVRGLYIPALVLVRKLHDSQEHSQREEDHDDQRVLWEKKLYTLFGRFIFAMGFGKSSIRFMSNSSEEEEEEVIQLANKKELELCKPIILKLTQASFDRGIVPTISCKMMEYPQNVVHTLSLFLSSMYTNQLGYLLENHLDTGLNLVGSSLNILRLQSLNEDTSAEAHTNAIDVLVVLVKACTCKALMIISQLLIIELSYRGSESVTYRMILYRAFEETAMAQSNLQSWCTSMKLHKEHKLHFQLVIDAISDSLQLESTLATNKSNSNIMDDAVEAAIYCEAALEAWTVLMGDEEYKPRVRTLIHQQSNLNPTVDTTNNPTAESKFQHDKSEDTATTHLFDSDLKISVHGGEDDNNSAKFEENYFSDELNLGTDQSSYNSKQQLKKRRKRRWIVRIVTFLVVLFCVIFILLLYMSIITLPSSTSAVIIENLVEINRTNTTTYIVQQQQSSYTPTVTAPTFSPLKKKRQRIYSISPTLSFIEDFIVQQEHELENITSLSYAYNSKSDTATSSSTTNHVPNENRLLSMDWILYQDVIYYNHTSREEQQQDDDDMLLSLTQRYVLALLYYSTTSTSTSTSNNNWYHCNYQKNTNKQKCNVKNHNNIQIEYSSWLSSTHECTWYGIKCYTDNKTISEINITSNNLTGTIPNELSHLLFLKQLSFSDNHLRGSIPKDIYNITSLQLLDIGGNSLKGTISTHISQLRNIRGLYLYNNLLTGSIPSQLFSLKSLLYLYMYNNSFIGSLPTTSTSTITSLEEIDLRYNQLTGAILQSSSIISYFHELKILKLNSNEFSGTISNDFYNTIGSSLKSSSKSSKSKLQILSLSNNKFTGFLTSKIQSLQSLEVLNIHSNKFQGSIPEDTIGKLVHLKIIHLYYNSFNGTIPDDICLLRSTSDDYYGGGGRLKDLAADCLGMEEDNEEEDDEDEGDEDRGGETVENLIDSTTFISFDTIMYTDTHNSTMDDTSTTSTTSSIFEYHTTNTTTTMNNNTTIRSLSIDNSNEGTTKEIKSNTIVKCECCTKCCNKDLNICNPTNIAATTNNEKNIVYNKGDDITN